MGWLGVAWSGLGSAGPVRLCTDRLIRVEWFGLMNSSCPERAQTTRHQSYVRVAPQHDAHASSGDRGQRQSIGAVCIVGTADVCLGTV